MGRIITVSSSKGGCSKSTVNMVLSATLAAMHYKVAVIDADPNACFANWHKLYKGGSARLLCEIQQDAIVDCAQEKASSFDVVLIRHGRISAIPLQRSRPAPLTSCSSQLCRTAPAQPKLSGPSAR